MNIPFPIIYPTMIGPDWFHADRPYDEDEELTRLEQENKDWLNSIGKQYMKPVFRHKPVPERVEEPEADDDVFIVPEETGESDGSHDVEEEEMPTAEEEMPAAEESSPPPNNAMEFENPEEGEETPEDDEETNIWPFVPQDQ